MRRLSPRLGVAPADSIINAGGGAAGADRKRSTNPAREHLSPEDDSRGILRTIYITDITSTSATSGGRTWLGTCGPFARERMRSSPRPPSRRRRRRRRLRGAP